MKTHQIKVIECKLCGITLKSDGQLRQHEINEHPEEFPFKCSCGKNFKSENAYEAHDKKCVTKFEFDEIC